MIPTKVHNGTTVITDPPNPLYYQQPMFDTITDSIVGHGTYSVNSNVKMSFLHSVGAGQTIELNAPFAHTELDIADPAHFHAHIVMNYVNPPGKSPPGWEQIAVGMEMVGRAVDSYSYHNDMLKLWYNDRVVQTLNLTVHDPYGITVQAAPGAWIFVSANDRTNHGIPFLNSPQPWPAMALHT